jgi:hypothetical protein
MINTTMDKALSAFSALSRVRGQVRGKTALDLFRMKNALKESVDFQAEEELKLVDEYGGVITDTGTIIIADKEKREAFLKARRELGEMACEVNAEPVRVDLEKNPDITMEDIEQMDGFVIFE